MKQTNILRFCPGWPRLDQPRLARTGPDRPSLDQPRSNPAALDQTCQNQTRLNWPILDQTGLHWTKQGWRAKELRARDNVARAGNIMYAREVARMQQRRDRHIHSVCHHGSPTRSRAGIRGSGCPGEGGFADQLDGVAGNRTKMLGAQRQGTGG